MACSGAQQPCLEICHPRCRDRLKLAAGLITSSRDRDILLRGKSSIEGLSLDASYFIVELLSSPPFQRLCPVICPMMLLLVFYYGLASVLKSTGGRDRGLVGVREA